MHSKEVGPGVEKGRRKEEYSAYWQSINHISLKNGRPRCHAKCTEHVSANARPHQLCRGDLHKMKSGGLPYPSSRERFLEGSTSLPNDATSETNLFHYSTSTANTVPKTQTKKLKKNKALNRSSED